MVLRPPTQRDREAPTEPRCGPEGRGGLGDFLLKKGALSGLVGLALLLLFLYPTPLSWRDFRWREDGSCGSASRGLRGWRQVPKDILEPSAGLKTKAPPSMQWRLPDGKAGVLRTLYRRGTRRPGGPRRCRIGAPRPAGPSAPDSRPPLRPPAASSRRRATPCQS